MSNDPAPAPAFAAHNLGLYFEQVARCFADRPALRMPGEVLTYRALDALSNRLARLLQQHDVGPGQVVAILSAKRPTTYALMLACLKLGAAYVHLDPASPPERLGRIIDKCQPRLTVSEIEPDPEARARWPVAAPVLEAGEELLERLETCSPEPLPRLGEVRGDMPAYLMFTSGSTGFPKGAVISHQNVLNFLRWSTRRFSVSPADCLTNVNPIYFDNSVFDVYTSLFAGASLAPVPQDVVADPKRLVETVEALGCTLWFSVPSLLVYLTAVRVLSKDRLPAVRTFVFGGEGYPKAELKKLFDMFSGRAKLVNVYGPTECTCICSSHDISPADFDDMKTLAPLGALNENFGGLVLDENDQPADSGELCLLGPNVGLGYYRDPDRTAQSFVQNPLNDAYPERMYRTGDIVRRTAPDRYQFLGRKDNQIKHMGYRIELEEIEAAINALPYVHQSAVIYVQRLTHGGHLHAYVAVASDAGEQRLREDLKAALPHYMMPHRFFMVAELPKNANGKVDRQRLVALAAEHKQEQV